MFELTPKGFPASELEFGDDEITIEKVLLHNDEELNDANSNLKTVQRNEIGQMIGSGCLMQRSNQDMANLNPTSSLISSFPNDLLHRKENAKQFNQEVKPHPCQCFPSNSPTFSNDTADRFRIFSNLDNSSGSASDNVSSANSPLSHWNISPASPVYTSSDFIQSSMFFPNKSHVLPNAATRSFQNEANFPALNLKDSCHINSSITCPNVKLPSLSRYVRVSQGQSSLQSTTLSQFTPKDAPIVTHAFRKLGPKVQPPQLGIRSSFNRPAFKHPHQVSSVPLSRDLHSDNVLVVNSLCEDLNLKRDPSL